MYERFMDIVTDLMSCEDLKVSTIKILKTLELDKNVMKHFLLFTFALTEGLTRKHSAKGFNGRETEFFEKVLEIENCVKECCESNDMDEVYKEALTLYEKQKKNSTTN